MYLKIAKNAKTGRTYLSVAKNYYDSEKKTSRTATLESLGYLDELEKTHDDPIAHFGKIVEERNAKEKEDNAEYAITARKNAELQKGAKLRKNYGYIVILAVLRELGLDRFFTNRQRGKKFEYNTASIMKLLVVSRILEPGSKKRAYENKNRYFDFEKDDAFSLLDVYRALSHFATIDADTQIQIHNAVSKKHGRNTNVVYYDVTNYYFEIEKEDELRAKGPSKEHRKDPIVQMGLATDADGIPISYELFRGNESEKLHLRPMVGELRRKYDSGRIVVVADAAQNTGDNVYYLESGKNGYVFCQTIAGGDADLQRFVLDETGYERFGDKHKRKSRIVRRNIKVHMLKNGKKANMTSCPFVKAQTR
jgi:hypothetical protein